MSDTKEKPCYVVLGATGGIGQEVIIRLTTRGARVMAAARNPDKLQELGESFDCPTYQLDGTKTDPVESCFRKALDEFGRLDGAVNCIGSLLLKPAHLTTDEDWDSTIDLNLRSAFATVRAAGKTMRSQGGSVVLMSSAAAKIGISGHEAIAAAKAGVIGLTRAAAASYASSGLRFNAVAPGLTKTPMTESIWSKDAAAAASEKMHPLDRLGEPGDIASAIVWLLDPTNTWVTGEVISVDGGISHAKPAVRRRPS